MGLRHVKNPSIACHVGPIGWICHGPIGWLSFPLVHPCCLLIVVTRSLISLGIVQYGKFLVLSIRNFELISSLLWDTSPVVMIHGNEIDLYIYIYISTLERALLLRQDVRPWGRCTKREIGTPYPLHEQTAGLNDRYVRRHKSVQSDHRH